MSTIQLRIDINGIKPVNERLQQVRNQLTKREPLHRHMAEDVKDFTAGHVAQLNRHVTAQRLGGKQTGFLRRAASSLQWDADEEAGYLVIPRRTGLGRAFGDVLLRPGSGRKYLTVPATGETYGKGVRDFPQGAFRFAILHAHRLFPVLLWTTTAGKHKKGDVAYWLRTSITQKQDRSLLPSDQNMKKTARDSAVIYLASVKAANGNSKNQGGNRA